MSLGATAESGPATESIDSVPREWTTSQHLPTSSSGQSEVADADKDIISMAQDSPPAVRTRGSAEKPGLLQPTADQFAHMYGQVNFSGLDQQASMDMSEDWVHHELDGASMCAFQPAVLPPFSVVPKVDGEGLRIATIYEQLVYKVTGPPDLVKWLLHGGGSVVGEMSEVSRVTLDADSRIKIHIPLEAEFFCFLYPPARSCGRKARAASSPVAGGSTSFKDADLWWSKALRQHTDEAWSSPGSPGADPRTMVDANVQSLLWVGGFAYFNKERALLQVNALAQGSEMQFCGPFLIPSDFAAQAMEQGQIKQRAQHVNSWYAWLAPGTNLTPQLPNGAFAFFQRGEGQDEHIEGRYFVLTPPARLVDFKDVRRGMRILMRPKGCPPGIQYIGVVDCAFSSSVRIRWNQPSEGGPVEFLDGDIAKDWWCGEGQPQLFDDDCDWQLVAGGESMSRCQTGAPGSPSHTASPTSFGHLPACSSAASTQERDQADRERIRSPARAISSSRRPSDGTYSDHLGTYASGISTGSPAEGTVMRTLSQSLSMLPKVKESRREHHLVEKRFKQLELVGEGGFGKVYKGLCLDNGGSVAMKIVDRKGSQKRREVEKEVNLMKTLGHENVVQILGFYSLRTTSVIVMEFVAGGSLTELIQKFDGSGLPLAMVKKLFQQAVHGVRYLSNHNVVHGDLKCDNILLTSQGVVKIADLGAAKLKQKGNKNLQDEMGHISSQLLDQNDGACTPLYCSPEALQGRFSAASDVWALGCICLEMATADRPWEHLMKTGVELVAIMYRYIPNEDHPMPTDPPLCDPLEDVICQSMKRDESARPSTQQLLAMKLFFLTAVEVKDMDHVRHGEDAPPPKTVSCMLRPDVTPHTTLSLVQPLRADGTCPQQEYPKALQSVSDDLPSRDTTSPGAVYDAARDLARLATGETMPRDAAPCGGAGGAEAVLRLKEELREAREAAGARGAEAACCGAMRESLRREAAALQRVVTLLRARCRDGPATSPRGGA